MIATKIVHCKRSQKLERDESKLMFSVTNLRQPSLVEDFYKQSFAVPHGSCDAVAFRTDVYMLFNQDRLDRMTQSQLSTWLDNQAPTDGLISLRNQLSDSQLHQFIKSRYIQSPSELKAWSAYLESEYGSELSKLQPAETTPAETTPAGTTPAETTPASAE